MTARKLAALALILALGFLWHAGTFDDTLVHVGLNAKPCVKNAYGATFCGSSAVSYCESIPASVPAPMCASLDSPLHAIPTSSPTTEEP